MTLRRNDPDRLSNWLDSLVRGIGHRGSSFMDLDALAHDGRTNRFLVVELKHAHESCSPAQRQALAALARLPQFTVWSTTLRPDDSIVWADFGSLDSVDLLTPDDFRALYQAWWDGRYRLSRLVVRASGKEGV